MDLIFQHLDTCEVNPCENGGHCRSSEHGIECACAGIYRGRYCESEFFFLVFYFLVILIFCFILFLF